MSPIAANNTVSMLMLLLLLITMSALTFFVEAKELKVLAIAPNFHRGQFASSKKMSHFALHKQLVEFLVAQDWVQKVHLLVPQVTSADSDVDFELKAAASAGKLVLEYFAASGMPETSEQVNFDEWGSEEDDGEPAEVLSYVGTEPDRLLAYAKQKDRINALRAERFDVGLAEVWYFAAFPLLWLAHVKHIVSTSAMPVAPVFYEFMDGYLHEIITQGDIPEQWSTECDDHMKPAKSENFANNFMLSVKNSNKAYDNMDDKFAQIYHEQHYHESDHPKNAVRVSPPKFRDLFRQSRHFFVNTQPFLDFPMPRGMPEKVVYIGGITLPSLPALHQHKRVPHAPSSTANSASSYPLDQMERKAVAAAARKRGGLVLVSFGTLVNMEKMPAPKFNAMLNAFDQRGDYEFVWKTEGNNHSRAANILQNNGNDNNSNVHMKPWLNQNSLLANPATKLFISHCGMNSIIEAVHFGVPLLCVPFFGDQYYNSEALARHGAAVVLDVTRMQEEGLFSEKMTIALGPSYKANMLSLQGKMSKTHPMQAFLDKMHELL